MLSIILNCDPLVGDTACQIRAIHLLHLYHLHNQGQAFSEADVLYIQQCQMLTILTEAKFLEFHIIDTESINLKKIALAPELFVNNTVNSKFIAKAQANIARRSLEFLTLIYEPNFFEAELGKYMELDSLYKSSSKQHIPIIPCFMSTQLMLYYLKQRQSLLKVTIKRLAVDQVLDSKECLWRS